MTPTLQTSNQLFVLRRKGYERVLAPGVAGTPTPIAADGILVRTQYIDAGRDVEEGARLAEPTLEHDHCTLLFLFHSPDGPPSRSARVFVDAGVTKISWIEDSRSHHSEEVRQFRAVAAGEPYGWESDARAGRGGFFITGHG